jgi:serine/threonine protein kinase
LSTANKTSMGVLRGTFRYISPDLFRGGAYSWMTDLWALGVTLFESSVGRKAAEGTQHQVFAAIMNGQIAAVQAGEQLHPALRYLFDGLLEVDADKRRFRDPEDVLHAFRVIRGRLGDGEQDTIGVMARVHIAMDEEAMEETNVAPDIASKSAPPAPQAAPPAALDEDLFAEKTLVSMPRFDDIVDDENAESTRTVDTAIGPAGPVSARRPPPPPSVVTGTAEWGEPTAKVPPRPADRAADDD